ncbi:hypothetical protein DOY81_005052 [Sarcophaga bullata]|nr:hypothetical protein DOY81_005052 [Sarcophaga bullata]
MTLFTLNSFVEVIQTMKYITNPPIFEYLNIVSAITQICLQSYQNQTPDCES